MALNISSQYTDPSTLDTLPSQDNQNVTNSQASSQEQILPTNNTISSPLEEGLKKIDTETSQKKDKDIIVELPKSIDGKTIAPEKMDFGKYEESFLKAAFQEVGLSNATPKEINNFQREYNSLTNNTIGLQVSLSELQNVQKQSSQGKIAVKVSDYDLKVLSAGKEQILANRQQQAEITNKAVEASRSYADDAIAGFYKVQLNGLVNTANEATKIVGLPAIPKLDVKGEFWKDKKEIVELATTAAAGVLTGKGVVGTVISASTGTAHTVELVTGEDIRTGEQLSPLERSIRFVSASSSAVAVSKPAKEFASKLASKFDDFDIGPPTLQPATANGVAFGNVSTSALPAVKAAPAGSPNSTNLFNVVSGATNGINQLPSLQSGSSTSKASNVSDPAELAAKNEAQRLDIADRGHVVDRHGPEVTNQVLEDRLTKGITPNSGGKIVNAPPGSTRFNTYKDLVETRSDAVTEIAKREGIDLSKPPAPGQKTEVNAVIDHGKPIDDGFVGDQSSKIRVVNPSTGRNVSVYSKADLVTDISRTYTKIAWNPTTQKWDVVQHFPSVTNWDNASKTYTTPADITIQKNTNPK